MNVMESVNWAWVKIDQNWRLGPGPPNGQHRIRKLQRRIRKLPGPRIRKLAVPRIRKLQRRIRKLPGPRIRKLATPRIRKLPGPRIRIRKLADSPGFGNFSVGFGNFQALGFGNLPIPPDSETSTSDSETSRGSDLETCLSPRIRKLQRRIRKLPGPRIRKLCHRQTASSINISIYWILGWSTVRMASISIHRRSVYIEDQSEELSVTERLRSTPRPT